ncbi:branched-chain amino acid ABC transporter permease [Variovorax sp. PvP013]|jgi:branched-chain amino acid transport system permease protein|uniref:branched-chain amino acid ABC transporter permease n=1 Tax=Variovorax sp. PvP013 TaxID=3156435 RepID=UPI003D19F924
MSLLDLQDLVQSVVDGIMFGTTYALIGIGFTLIFGVMHKINLSYAAASVGAAYLSLIVVNAVPAPLVYLTSALAGGLLGALVYVVCFRFLPLDKPLATLMSTVGMLLLLEEAIVHATAGMPQNYPTAFTGANLDIGPFTIRGDLLAVFALGCAAMVGLKLLLERTRLGLATRAVAQQPVAARLCGMGVDRTNASTFVIAGFLGGTAGAMTGAAIGVLSPLLALPLTVKGLVVTVIGGLGSIPGAIVAGLIVGGVENLFQFWRGVSERDIYVMLMLFAFLVFRPGGLFAAPGGRD